MRALRNLAFAGLVLFGVTARADIVTTWSYTVTSVFDTTTTAFVPGSGGTTNTPTLLAWGTPSNPANEQSSLEILDNPAMGVVDTSLDGVITPPDEVGITQTFVHNNNVIATGSTQLDSVDVITTLALTPVVPPGAPLPPFPSITFNVNFQETPNGGPCAAGTGATPCADIFVLSGNLNAFSFDYDGQTYFVQIFPFTGTPLVPLSDAACAAAGASSGCIGFLTAEGTSNEVQFAFAITTRQIPEPGSLALVALGLLGAGLTMRKRRSLHR